MNTDNITSKEKQKILQNLKNTNSFSASEYYEILENIGDMKYNYSDYMITEPISCDEELNRLSNADYDLCCALLTMLLREDHFSNGSFTSRCRSGQIPLILDRMISLLSCEE